MNSSTLLLIVDVQKGLDDPALGRRNNPQAEGNIARLLQHWRKNEFPIVHIRHDSTEPDSPLRPEMPGNAFKPQTQPIVGEQQFSKNVNNAFVGTGLEDHLRAVAISSLVIVGLTTDHCVSSTVRMAANLGFKVRLVSDATAAFERTGHDGAWYSAEDMHNINLASLNNEFCQILSTSDVLNL